MVRFNKKFFVIATSCIITSVYSQINNSFYDSFLNNNNLIIAQDNSNLIKLDNLVIEKKNNDYISYIKADKKSKVDVLVPYELNEDLENKKTELYKARLEKLNQKSPIQLDYNDDVRAFIEMYLRRENLPQLIARRDMYFPLFEEALSKYNLPYELKYLPVIESALLPQAGSHAGAKGLWQFIYTTGKIYDLNISSYYDERFDPVKSTEAACKFLKSLYDIYGDWQLVLAAYNSGPGNVNKAIRKAGGNAKDFWAIRKFLPRETSNYVPIFIAANYIMNYYEDHGINRETLAYNYFDFETVFVDSLIHFEVLAKYLGESDIFFKDINPIYTKNIIPDLDEQMPLRLPFDKIGIFTNNIDSIYYYSDLLANPKKAAKILESNAKEKSEIKDSNNIENVIVEEIIETEKPIKTSNKKDIKKLKYHKVKKGETLTQIAIKYSTTVPKLKKLNGMRSNTVRYGQNLKVN